MAREKRIKSFRELRALWREDLATYHGQFTRPGFQAIVVHRLGVWKHGLESRPLRMPLSAIYRLANLFVRNVYGIELALGRGSGGGSTSRISTGLPSPRRGDRRRLLIQQMTTIGHTAAMVDGVAPPAPRLGRRVRVGVGAVLAGDIDIGDDVVIGPNAVVIASVPEGTMVTPCRHG